MLSTAPYKGTRDFYPDEMRFRRWMFGKMDAVCRVHGYEEVLGPLLEPFELYAAKTGEEIVNQQLYHFVDRGERKMALRPEMTPTLARMAAARLHELPKPVRWYSIGNFHRYERPQRGRLREFWQLNVDILGGDELLADVEILEVALRVMESYGGLKHCKVQVNHRGLVDGFFREELGLDASRGLALTKILDARQKIGEDAFAAKLSELGVPGASIQEIDRFLKAPLDGRTSHEALYLKKVFEVLGERGLRDRVEFNPGVLRGLDYYTGMVFELYDVSPENRRAMFGGGRYDNLLGLFGVKPGLSGVGFGMGDVTLENFLETHALKPADARGLDVFVSIPAEPYRAEAGNLALELRARGLSAVTALEVSGFGAQLKQASRLGARYAVLFGDAEWAKNEVVVKDLENGEQRAIPRAGIADALKGSAKR